MEIVCNDRPSPPDCKASRGNQRDLHPGKTLFRAIVAGQMTASVCTWHSNSTAASSPAIRNHRHPEVCCPIQETAFCLVYFPCSWSELLILFFPSSVKPCLPSQAAPCLAPPGPAPPCQAKPCPACQALPSPAVPRRAPPRPASPCRAKPRPASPCLPCPAPPRHAPPGRAAPGLATPSHALP